jgi:hypothetical protein
LLGNLALADQPSSNTVFSKGLAFEALAPLTYLSVASLNYLPGGAEGPYSVIEMAPFRVEPGSYPKYSEMAEASLKSGLLEPCALIKTNVDAKRRFDLFFAPVALNNGAAGFGIVRMSW